jgi:hypothetical protein
MRCHGKWLLGLLPDPCSASAILPSDMVRFTIKKIPPLVGTDEKQNVGTDPGSCQKKLGLCSEKFPNVIRKIVRAPDPLIKCQGACNSATNVE